MSEGFTEEERALARELADRLTGLGLGLPALFSLEAFRPMGWLTSQWMHILSPAVDLMMGDRVWQGVAGILERREGVELLLRALEESMDGRPAPETSGGADEGLPAQDSGEPGSSG